LLGTFFHWASCYSLHFCRCSSGNTRLPPRFPNPPVPRPSPDSAPEARPSPVPRGSVRPGQHLRKRALHQGDVFWGHGFSFSLLCYPSGHFPSGATCGPHSVGLPRCPPLQEAQRQAHPRRESFPGRSVAGSGRSRRVAFHSRRTCSTSPRLCIRGQTPCQAPVISGSCSFLSMLETERAVKADCTPATQHDTGKADAARRVENPSHRAVLLLLMEQPMLHPPTATCPTALLPNAAAIGPTELRLR
jgi:hypothetical protein